MEEAKGCQNCYSFVTRRPRSERTITIACPNWAIARPAGWVSVSATANTMVQMNLQLRNSSFSHLFVKGRRLHFSGFNHVPRPDRPDRAGTVTYY